MPVEDCEHTEAEVAQLIEPEPTLKPFHSSVEKVNVITQEKTNPFINRTAKMTVYEWIKIVLMAPIATIRLLLILILAIFIYLSCALAMCGNGKTADPELGDLPPLGRCRRLLLVPMQYMLRVLLFLMGYMYIQEKGCCPLACQSCPASVIVANHVSFVEPAWFIYKFLPGPVGQAGLLDAPIINKIMLSITPIAVDRDTQDGRSRAGLNCNLRPQSGLPVSEAELKELEQEAAEAAAYNGPREEWKKKSVAIKRAHLERRKRVQEGKEVPYQPLLIFPEGTTSGDNTLLQFKKGGFISGQPVQPVVVQYPYCHFEACWSSDLSVVWMAWRMLSQVYNRMTIHYLPVIEPTAEEMQDPDLFARNVRATMAEAMPSVHCTEHAYEDLRLLGEAQRNYSKGTEFAVTDGMTYSNLHEHLDISVDNCKNLITKFGEMDTNNNGKVSRKEFYSALHLDPYSDFSENMFRILDPDGDDEIDFRTLVQGLVLVSGKIGEDEKVQLVFEIYDMDHDGKVRHKELVTIMERQPATATKDNSLKRCSTISTAQAEELADKVLESKEYLEIEEFRQAVREHPELLKYAIEDLSTWMEGVVDINASSSDANV